jgi:hypothetical protein
MHKQLQDRAMQANLLRWSFLAAFVILAAVSRVFQPLPNFTAIGALALISALMAPRAIYAFAVTGAGMLLGDLLLAQFNGSVGFSPDWTSYLGFGLIVGMGLVIRRNPAHWKTLAAGLTASLVFFLFSNGAVWVFSVLKGGDYSADGSGLLDCYAAGLPFYRAMFLGDLLYMPLGFGSMAAVLFFEAKRSAQTARETV